MAVTKLITFLFQHCVVAFNFAHEDEARNIRTVLNQKLEAKKQRRIGELALCHYETLAVLRITSSKWIKSPWIWSQLVTITADDWIAALIKKTSVCHNWNFVWNVLHKACLTSFLVHGCFIVFICHSLGCYDTYLTMLHYWQLNTVNVSIP